MVEEEAVVTVATAEKRKRAKNWDTHEILLLVQAKKEEWERQGVSSKVETAGDKWAKVVEFMQSKGVLERDSDQCRGKWDNLLSDYKTIRDWRRQVGGARAYGGLTRDEKKLSKLPACFDPQVMELLESFQGKRPLNACAVYPPMLLAMEGEGDAGAAAAVKDEALGEYGEGQNLEQELLMADEMAGLEKGQGGGGGGGGYGAGVGGCRKRKRKNQDLVSAVQEMAEFFLSSVMGMEKRREIRHAKRLEFEREKVVVEREDRRELVGVLGELVKTFEKIAEKM